MRAIRHSVGRDGKGLFIMPSDHFNKLSDEDLGAIIAYLKNVPPVDNEVDLNTGLVAKIIALFEPDFFPAGLIDHDAVRPLSPAPDVTAEYGEYITFMCTLCHGEHFSGGTVPGEPGGSSAPNLTLLTRAKWSEKDFFKEAMFKRVKGPAELVAGTMRLSGSVTRQTQEMVEARELADVMGQTLLNPPAVEGWQAGTEWINSGALVDRVNFAAKVMGGASRPGVRAIIDRLAAGDGGAYSPDELVGACLDLMGPIAVSHEAGRTALVEHVVQRGPLSLAGTRTPEAEERVADLLAVISSTRECQLA